MDGMKERRRSALNEDRTEEGKRDRARYQDEGESKKVRLCLTMKSPLRGEGVLLRAPRRYVASSPSSSSSRAASSFFDFSSPELYGCSSCSLRGKTMTTTKNGGRLCGTPVLSLVVPPEIDARAPSPSCPNSFSPRSSTFYSAKRFAMRSVSLPKVHYALHYYFGVFSMIEVTQQCAGISISMFRLTAER